MNWFGPVSNCGCCTEDCRCNDGLAERDAPDIQITFGGTISFLPIYDPGRDFTADQSNCAGIGCGNHLTSIVSDCDNIIVPPIVVYTDQDGGCFAGGNGGTYGYRLDIFQSTDAFPGLEGFEIRSTAYRFQFGFPNEIFGFSRRAWRIDRAADCGFTLAEATPVQGTQNGCDLSGVTVLGAAL